MRSVRGGSRGDERSRKGWWVRRESEKRESEENVEG